MFHGGASVAITIQSWPDHPVRRAVVEGRGEGDSAVIDARMSDTRTLNGNGSARGGGMIGSTAPSSA